jgi:cytochrome c
VAEAGPDKAFAEFSDPKGAWVKGELYGFCHTLEGVSVAHGGNPSLIGKNLLGVKDPDGALVNVLVVEKAKKDGKGWVEYKWPNPTTKKIAPKRVYVEKVADNYVCGSGYYVQ